MEASIDLFMATVTGIGDAAITIPIAGILLVSFCVASAHVALRWFTAVTLCGVATAAAKIALFAQGPPGPAVWLASPSGHVAASLLVYGALALTGPPGLRRTLQITLAALIVTTVGASRIYLGKHSPADVLAGLAIGGACLAWFARDRRVAGAWSVQAGALASVAVCLAGAAQGWHLSLEPWFHEAAEYVAAGPGFGSLSWSHQTIRVD